MQVKLCLWHALQQINKHILARPKAKPEAPKASPQQIATTAGDNESSEDDMEEGDGEKDGQFDPEEVPSYLQQFFRNPVVTAFLNTVKSAAKDKPLCTRHVTGAYLDAEVLVTGTTRKDVSLYHRLSMDRGSPLRLSLSLLLLYGDQFSWEEASIIIRVRAL